jgi:hypothetical protein
MRRSIRTSSLLLALASGACLSLAPLASAQNALGDGRALDNNLRVGSNRVNDRGRDFQREFRARQAIVTGNAPGGLSFRGSVGYTSERDFRGGLPSDQLFTFERDSLLSGFATRGIRGVDALQYQQSFTTGVAPPEFALPVERPGAGASGATLRPRASDPFTGIDPFTLRPGALRSSSTLQANDSLSLRLLGRGELEDGSTVFAVASPLRSVTVQRTPSYPGALPPDSLESYLERDRERFGALEPRLPGDARDQEQDEEATPRIGALNRLEPEQIDQAERASGRLDERASTRIEPARAEYQRLVNELRAEFEARLAAEAGDVEPQPEGPRPSTEPRRDLLEEIRRGAGDADDDEGADALRPEQGTDTDAEREQERASGLRRFDETLQRLRERLSAAEVGARIDEDDDDDEISTLIDRLAADDPLRVERLSPPAGPERDLVAERMRLGERAIAEGRWFDAEEHFASALRMQPDNAFAAIGRIHAQIGAGLFRSAASNLSELMRLRPELINVRFDESLRPTGERLEEVLGVLRIRLEEATGASFRSSLGLLTAYLGHQTGEAALVRQGFAAIDEARGDTALPDPLITVLRRVWTRESGE